MTNAYFYSNVAVPATLTGSIGTGTTSATVNDTTGWPSSYPYVVAMSFEGATEELVKVTNNVANTLTIQRAFGGTTAQNHSSGAVVKHIGNATDLTDFRTHEQGASGVHGVVGALVGLTDTQTLTNKTLTSPVINAGSLSGTFTGTPTFSGAVVLSGGPNISAGATLAGTFSGTPTFSGGLTFSGTPVFSAGASLSGTFSGTHTVSGTTSQTGAFTASNTASLTGGGTFTGTFAGNPIFSGNPVFTAEVLMRRAGASDTALAFRLNADGDPRLIITPDGAHTWGDGSGLGDTNLYRSAADVLKTDDTFTALVATTTTGLTAASGFGAPVFAGRKTCGITSVSGEVSRSGGTINADAEGNITDTLCSTLPSGWRPPHLVVITFSVSGVASGMAEVDTSGTVTLKTLNEGEASINSGQIIYFSGTWVA